MNKSNHATAAAKKVLENQQLQQTETASENEESDSITDQSSCMSEKYATKQQQRRKQHNQQQQQYHSKAGKCIATLAPTTQFSVHADGLRMKISAIRPSSTTTATATTVAAVNNSSSCSSSSSSSSSHSNTEAISKETFKQQKNNNHHSNRAVTNSLLTNHKYHSSNINNNNSLLDSTTLKLKIINTTPAATTTTATADIASKSNMSLHALQTAAGSNTFVAADTNHVHHAHQQHYQQQQNTNLSNLPYAFSDATETDCSEATTTTIAAAAAAGGINDKAVHSKKIKVKRKKAHSTKSDGKKSACAKKPRNAHLSAFSSDSEDEQQKQQQLQQHQQHNDAHKRAPRLLFTAINTKNAAVSQLKPLSSLLNNTNNNAAAATENMALSSSDNELPDLVSAAIKRVESDTDDTDTVEVGFRKAKSKQLPQYQSTLLQDFMVKTQNLGQTPAHAMSPSIKLTTTTSSSNSSLLLLDNIAASSSNSSCQNYMKGAAVGKRRGRPKKTDAAQIQPQQVSSSSSLNINESADSGVISTTSTNTQSSSLSPLPKGVGGMMSSVQRGDSSNSSPAKTNLAQILDTLKPKIDMSYLDKRMYATERVLYPPPRNKRRAQKQTTTTVAAATTSAAATATAAKEELQLDPVWRKIDVNKKFRRPSLSGYKSDGGGGNTTICSKILAAKSGYVSDYGSFHARSTHHHQHASSGYKSDASCKSRYSTKSCASRRSRAKSCGYRSDCKDSAALNSLKNSKFRRKQRRSCALSKTHSKSVGNLNDEQDILQLAGLSLGQSSEESNGYACKPNLHNLPATATGQGNSSSSSVCKKYGEINRYIATGEYFGGFMHHHNNNNSFANLHALHNDAAAADDDDDVPSCSQQQQHRHNNKMQRNKQQQHAALTREMLHHHDVSPSHHSRSRIKSRRSSAASYCSSYYSGVSRPRRRRSRHRSLRFPSSSRNATVDSKLLTDIEILIGSFGALCCIRSSAEKPTTATTSAKDKAIELLHNKPAAVTNVANANAATTAGSSQTNSSKRDLARDKRALKKRKVSENLDFAMLSSQAAGNNNNVSSLTPSSGGSSKRRHKKASNSSSSPDDHKLPLKKRHYLLTPGEKSEAVAAKLFANNAEAWVAAAAAAKSSAFTKSQQQYGARASKPAVTPKKRHLLQNACTLEDAITAAGSSSSNTNCSPLRVLVTDTNSISGGKLLDISPIAHSLKQQQQQQQSYDAVHKKRTRLEGLVSRIAHQSDEQCKKSYSSSNEPPQLDSENSSCPPPGVFEPSIELNIQIPAISKLTAAVDAVTNVITKYEVDSPLLVNELHKGYAATNTKLENGSSSNNAAVTAGAIGAGFGGVGVVETLLNKTGANLLLRRKRKKINRTGFPTVRRKKRKNDSLSSDAMPETEELTLLSTTTLVVGSSKNKQQQQCDRVPQTGEASDSFMQRATLQRTPRVSVVALERLQGTATTAEAATAAAATASANVTSAAVAAVATEQQALAETKRKSKKRKHSAEQQTPAAAVPTTSKQKRLKLTKEPAPQAQLTTVKPKPQPQSKLKSKKSNEKTPANKVRNASSNKSNNNNNNNNNVQQKNNSNGSSKSSQQQQEQQQPKIIESNCKFSKSTVHKILNAKSFGSNVKLPDNYDPKTNLNCKIMLKRQKAMLDHRLAANNSSSNSKKIAKNSDDEEAAFDRSSIKPMPLADEIEHEPLPTSDRIKTIKGNIFDYDSSSDTDSTNNNNSTSNNALPVGVSKPLRHKKTYLPAGLFANFYKNAAASKGKRGTAAVAELDAAQLKQIKQNQNKLNAEGNPISILLPPPPYCERFVRRRQRDFLLPHDIYWAHKNAKLPSRNTVPSWNYRKIRTNIYADSVKPNLSGFEHPTCNCKPATGCGDGCLNRMVYTECSPSNCPALDNCHNQKIQRHEVAPGIERFMTANKGWGVRTKLPIAKGIYILEYVGEVVTEREFKDRMGSIYLNDIHHYCLHLDGGLVIDGHRMGSEMRFVNHSCMPNCEMQKWSVNGLSRMALFAKRAIEAGEELTYDYNFALFNPAEGQTCRCNTAECRGVIGGKSQRVKPLPIETKPSETNQKDGRNAGGRQRKRKARKNPMQQRIQSKDVVLARVQKMSEKEKQIVKQSRVFLMRVYEKRRRLKAKRNGVLDAKTMSVMSSSPASPCNSSNQSLPSVITARRSSTPSSLAVQISALCNARNIKTRGLTLAVQDPELEKMAKMAVVLRDICTHLETFKDEDGKKLALNALTCNNSSNSNSSNNSCGSGKKNKKATPKALVLSAANQKQKAIDLKLVQTNIEQGYYKQPKEFDVDMQRIFAAAKLAAETAPKQQEQKLKSIQLLLQAYEQKKQANYEQLQQIIGDEADLRGFRAPSSDIVSVDSVRSPAAETATATADNIAAPIEQQQQTQCVTTEKITDKTTINTTSNSPLPADDIIRCICGLYKDEGLMIQCARCMVWQHAECTKADITADNYLCENCEPRQVDREIPLEDFTEEGHRYYLSLMRGQLHVRQGDAVYVLRDIPIRDAAGNIVPSQKHTYETIGDIDYNECDIFRVERLWKNEEGKRFIFGHHFLRPHETFHEPSRRFYPNEVVRVPLYEVVPIELVIGRCWVLDRTTFCKGRPIECNDDKHCYICELRVDKTARLFTKVKANYPPCTKSYAFRKFAEKLKISKSYAPHHVDPAMLKTKKQKIDEQAVVHNRSSSRRSELNKTPQITGSAATTTLAARKRKESSKSSSNGSLSTLKTIKAQRQRLENVLKTIKIAQQCKQPQLAHTTPIDLSYLLSGRGARQRKTFTSTSAAASAALFTQQQQT